MAILREDENEVQFLLDKFPSYSSEVNFCGQSPVHIAVQLQNPSLLSLLLRYVDSDTLNVADNGCKYPIDFAFLLCTHEPDLVDQNHCVMSRMVELLLESNSVLFRKQLSVVFRDSCKCAKTLTLQHLAKRRKELEQLAISHLPSAEIRSLGLCKRLVLDLNAVNVLKCLAAHHYNTPIHLMACSVDDEDMYIKTAVSVYVHIRDRETAEFAFSLGFDKKTALLDAFRYVIWEVSIGVQTQTPPSLSYVEWLVDGGVQLESVIPVDFMDKVIHPATWAHYLMARLGSYYSWENAVDETSPPSVAAVVLSGTIRDECLCYCSLHGCSPLSKFLQAFEAGIRPIRVHQSSWIDIQTIERLLIGLQTFISEGELSCSWIPEAVLRYLTFSTLGLRHTCCVLDNSDCEGYLDPEEINEIHEEDSATLQLLERLVAEFQPDYGRIVALGPLLRDRWLPKIREVLEEIQSQRLTEEELRKAEDYGVIWEQEQPLISRDKLPYDLEGWMKKLDDIAPDPQRPTVSSLGS